MKKVQLKTPSIKTWQVMVTIVAFALGILLTYQSRVAEQVHLEQSSQSERIMGLQAILDRTKIQWENGEKEVAQLRKEMDSYVNNSVTVNQTVPNNIVKDYDTYRMLAGLVPVQGPGIIITIESKSPGSIEHTDLLGIINILRFAGAEAIDLNGQRIVASTGIHEAGSNILVNMVPIANQDTKTFRIVAIGDAAKLENYLKVTDRLLDTIKLYNNDIQIQQSNGLNVPALTGGSQFKLAQPVKTGK